jgi:hypothetical protein
VCLVESTLPWPIFVAHLSADNDLPSNDTSASFKGVHYFSHIITDMRTRRSILIPLLYLLTVSYATMSIQPRQDMETRTIDPLTSSLELQTDASVTATDASPTTSRRLETAKAPINLANTIGLIMPNPWSKVYVGEFRWV